MIVRAKRNTNFTIMSNVGLEDSRLSLKAKGMLAHLLSKPDNWQVSDRQLSTIGPDGRAAVQAALKELETYGYLKRTRVRNDDGTFTWLSTIYDEPWLGYPATVQPATVQPATENRAKISTVGASTDGTNTVLKNNDDDDRVRGEVVKAYQENIGVIAPLVGEQLFALVDEVGQLSVMAGILAAANQNKRSFAYMQKCARNHASGIEKPAARATTTNGQGKDRIHEAAEASRKMLIAAGKEHLL